MEEGSGTAPNAHKNAYEMPIDCGHRQYGKLLMILAEHRMIRSLCKAQLIAAKGEIRNRVPITTTIDILMVAKFSTGKSLFRLGA
jgi:hypothetical protein